MCDSKKHFNNKNILKIKKIIEKKIKYYKIINFFYYKVCNYKCSECSLTSTNCLYCNINRITPPTCSCNIGFYEPITLGSCLCIINYNYKKIKIIIIIIIIIIECEY